MPPSSSRTSARTIERPVPFGGSAGMPGPSSAISSTASPSSPRSATCTCVPPCSSAFPSSSEKTSASAVARLPASDDRLELGRHLAPGADALDEHRPQPVEQVGEVDVLVALLGQHLVDGRDREDPVDRVLERLARVDVLGVACLQAQQRGDGLQVVLDAMVDLLGEHAAHDRAPVLERDGRLLGDRGEQLAVRAA